jgi:uncharacterized protein (UPF0335 family)
MSLVSTDTSARLRVPKSLKSAGHVAKRQFTSLADTWATRMQNVRKSKSFANGQHNDDESMRIERLERENAKLRMESRYPNETGHHRRDHDESMRIERLERENAKLRKESRHPNETDVRPRGYEDPKPMYGHTTSPYTESTIYQDLPGPLFRRG